MPLFLLFFLEYVALTIDDSPTESTSAILDILKIYHVKATFFVISSLIPGRESIMQRIVDEGHEIGNHTDVDEASWRLSKLNFETSFLRCEAAISKYQPKIERSISNVRPESDLRPYRWFRPGHGIITSVMLKFVCDEGYRTAITNVFPLDANGLRKCQSSNCVVNAWYLRNRVRSGAIVVIHDRSWTAPTLERCLDYLTVNFCITTLSKTATAYESANVTFVHN